MCYENNSSTMRISAPKQHQYMIMQLITGLSNLRTKMAKLKLNEGKIVPNASFCDAILYDLNAFLV